MKSVTCEACRRSIRLPSAPPTMRLTGNAVFQSPRGVRDSHVTSTPLITIASATKNQRCQPSPAARKLKAAPLLNASVQLRKPGMTGCGVPAGCNDVNAHHLLSWSSTMTTTESRSQDRALGLGFISRHLACELPLPFGERVGVRGQSCDKLWAKRCLLF